MMSTSTLSVHEEHEKHADVEKSPPNFVEDVEGLDPIARAPTTPPAQITDLDKGLIAWESQTDPENPLSVLIRFRLWDRWLTRFTDIGLRRKDERT
jgi:hypothetical protein